MPRKKIEFTEEQNFRIAQMVEINKSLQEIADDLERNFGIKVHYQTVQKQIDSLGLTRLDGRKYSGNFSRGYAAVVESTQEKPLSTYKLKKMDCGCMCTKELAKAMGYDKKGLPANYRLIKDKTGEVVDVELLITSNNIKTTGGADCEKGSQRWWAIERMRFDFGCKGRGLLKGQERGDWRGVVDRFNYKGDGTYRFDKFDIVKEQQEAWERYVDAAFEVIPAETGVSTVNNHTNNKFIINHFGPEQITEMIEDAPELIYKYIPRYLYSKVICYCLDKMYDDRRVYTGDATMLNSLRNIISKITHNHNEEEACTITFDLVKKCLYKHPNDYANVIRSLSVYAIKAGMVDRSFVEALTNMIVNVKFKSVDTKEIKETEGTDWFSDPYILHNLIYGQEERLNNFCKKYDILL